MIGIQLLGRLKKKLECWKVKLLSIGDRLILIKSVLCAISIYWLSIFRMPAKVKKRIDQLHRRFPWYGGSSVRKKYCLASWKIICTSKEQSGLGIINLVSMNKSLLGKWLWRFYNPNDTSLWKEIILSKYGTRRFSIHFSSFWKGVCKDRILLIWV